MNTLEILTQVLQKAYSFPVYPIAYAYCIYRIIKRHMKSSHDIIGYNPEWELIGFAFVAPLFAPIDIFVSIYKSSKAKWLNRVTPSKENK